MLSRRFFAWVGVGVIGAATIPTLAAPQLAKLASRKPPAKTTTGKAPAKTALKTPVKPTVKSAALTHRSNLASSKKLATSHTLAKATAPETGRLAARHADAVAKMDLSGGSKAPAAHKPAVAPKTLAHKPSASATAKKLLH